MQLEYNEQRARGGNKEEEACKEFILRAKEGIKGFESNW